MTRSAAGTRVAVIGAGAWGTTLAHHLAGAGAHVRLWARESTVVESINAKGENTMYLKGFVLDREGFSATNGLADALSGSQTVVWACPVQFSRTLLNDAAPFIPADAMVVTASKGIEVDTLKRMDQIFAETLPRAQTQRLCVLSGPSFASEVMRGAPTAVVVASRDDEVALRAQSLFQTDRFRVYTNSDVIGVELAGALKNVIAVAAGVAAGLDLGHNAVAALITRGMAEITRLGVALGAQSATFAGLAGMGDLVLTCTGGLSRNRAVGMRLGQGQSIAEILDGARTVAEGIATVRAACQLGDRQKVEMPVSAEVFRIVVEGADPVGALNRLMAREPKSEQLHD